MTMSTVGKNLTEPKYVAPKLIKAIKYFDIPIENDKTCDKNE